MEVVFQPNEDVNQKKTEDLRNGEGQEENSKRSPKVTVKQKPSGA